VKHPFFINNGPFRINDLLRDFKLNNITNSVNELIVDIKNLQAAEKEHLTFFHSKKYHLHANFTKP